MHSSKKRFYDSVTEKVKGKSPNLHFVSDPDSLFYELCQEFLDIPLNSQKIKDDEGNLQGVYLHTDINKTCETTVDFFNKSKLNSINELNELLDLIFDVYPDSEDDNESRQTYVFVRSQQTKQMSGYCVDCYDFTMMADNILEKIRSQTINLAKDVGKFTVQ